jgi:hypothetical protein
MRGDFNHGWTQIGTDSDGRRFVLGCGNKMRARAKFGINILAVLGILVVAGMVYYKWRFPYGASHCCILVMAGSLEQYANDNAGHYPAGQSSPEASLSLMYRSNYLNAYMLRGMTVSEKTTSTILKSGGLLGPDTCGWHYTEGLTKLDDPKLALLYCKQALGHNGQRTEDGGRQVVFVGGDVEWISGEKWPSFVAEQKALAANRSARAKMGKPPLNAIAELPNGTQLSGDTVMDCTVKRVEMRSDNSSGDLQTGGTMQLSLALFDIPMAADYSGRATWTLSFSNLVSAPVIVDFTNGVPDQSNVVFKMREK